MRTWRSSDIADSPRTTGRPARAHASVPPSMLNVLPKPAASIRSHALAARVPDLQMK